jgi:glucosamine--fructose-6-phosphate aminotransferase (isomerizing)
MCGLVGYIGQDSALPYLMEGLKRLEYRGYDSAGIALQQGGKIEVRKRQGKIVSLEADLEKLPKSCLGIGHNRWATHGAPSDRNAHPHLSQNGKIAIAHNGIIENYQDLQDVLKSKGYSFNSDTDSEVIAHYTQYIMEQKPELSFVEAIKEVVPHLSGTYGILFIHADHPHTLIGVRNGSPLCFGLGDRDGEFIISSDVVAFATHLQRVIHMEDREMVIIEDGKFRTTNFSGADIMRTPESIDAVQSISNKGDYEHFMLKEIHEQPQSILRAIRGRLLPDEGSCKLGGLNLSPRDLMDIDQVCFVGCGTSYHAGLLGVYLMEQMARIPATAEIAPELKYRNPIVKKNTLYVGISQSGETVDTNSTLQEIINKGGHVIGICNVVGSSMARLAGAGIYVHAGLEVSVCSTKAFTSQIAAIYQLAILISRSRDYSLRDGIRLVEGFQNIPEKVGEILKKADEIHEVAKSYKHLSNYLFMGRGVNYAVALEGALKLKEIAYVFAQGYSSSEMKHGAIALIDPECASIFIVPDDDMKSKNLSNIEEVRARNGRVLAIATEGDTETAKVADDVLYIPRCEPELTPFLSVIYLQFFAYYVALELGREIDQPRNLAKSVTVE